MSPRAPHAPREGGAPVVPEVTLETQVRAWLRIAAADLYATHGENPTRAAALYREVQRIPELMSGQDIYVSNKLADLYLGALKEPGRALVEFRRIAQRYPGSTAARYALAAIANLKPDVMREADQSSS